MDANNCGVEISRADSKISQKAFHKYPCIVQHLYILVHFKFGRPQVRGTGMHRRLTRSGLLNFSFPTEWILRISVNSRSRYLLGIEISFTQLCSR